MNQEPAILLFLLGFLAAILLLVIAILIAAIYRWICRTNHAVEGWETAEECPSYADLKKAIDDSETFHKIQFHCEEKKPC